MSRKPSKKILSGAPARAPRGGRADTDQALPQAAMPTNDELRRLMRLADGVATGKEPLTLIKI